MNLNSASQFIVELNGMIPGVICDQLAAVGTVNLGLTELVAPLGFPSVASFRFVIIKSAGAGHDSVSRSRRSQSAHLPPERFEPMMASATLL